jgi:hypothetical protein
VTAWSKAVEEGNASKGIRHWGRLPLDREVHDLRVEARPRGRPGSPKRGEPHGRLRGATNPQAVEGAGLRIRPLRRKPLKPGGTAGTEHVRDVAVPDRSLGDGPGGCGRSDGRVGGGAIDEPHERSPGRRGRPSGRPRFSDRANRYASEQESRRCLDPMRSIYGTGSKGQRTTHARGVSDDTPSPRPWCEIAFERRRDNLERPWVPARRPTPGS